MLIKEGGVEFIDTGNSGAVQFEIPKDRGGVFIFAGKNFRGDIECRIKLYLDTASFSSLDLRELTYAKVYGIEMVYIPKESFYEGDQDTTAFSFAAAYDPKTKSPFRIDSEKEIKIGLENDLYYDAGSAPQYRGDQKGPIPGGYPKGYKSFYIMKYEISQGQYADFLNSIYVQHGAIRANTGGKEYYPGRGTIVLKENTYIAGKPGEPLNSVSWDDGCAFADWACLRPVSELEFVKAARGPGRPVPNDYPWGSSSKEKLKRYFNENGELVFADDLNESQLSDENKEEFGASFYWVMDMASGYWERVVGYGNSTGRAFKGTNGDGRLSSFGDALRTFVSRPAIGDCAFRELPFDQIPDEAASGRADFGLLIHEGQLTFADIGLHKVLDLGEWWLLENGLPLPLGVNVAGRDIERLGDLSEVLAEAIRCGLENRDEALEYALQFGRGIDEAVADRFIEMYVNELTEDYGEEGRSAVAELLRRGEAIGAFPRPVQLDFV